MPSIPIPPPAAAGAPAPHDHVAGLLSAYGDGWLTSPTGSHMFDGLLIGVAGLTLLAIARMRITPAWPRRRRGGGQVGAGGCGRNSGVVGYYKGLVHVSE
jgi:hypothetical protein